MLDFIKTEKIILLFYLVAGLFLLLNNPPPLGSDMFFYYSVARQYSEGDFFHALNGYWAPLLTWLLALCFKTGIFWKALQVVNLAGGYLLVWYSIKIGKLLKLSLPGRILLTLLNASLALAFQLDSNTPDFLSAVCLAGFVFYYYREQLTSSSYGWIRIVVSALVLIFCKVFYLYFVIVFLLADGLFENFADKKRKWNDVKNKILFKQLAMIIGVYLSWVIILSVKYERFVFSSTGSYNSSIGTPNGNTLQYYTYSGLVEPKGNLSLGNEDPTYANIALRKPFESKQAFQYQLGIWKYNFQILNYLFSYFSYFKWVILFIPFGLLFFGNFPERAVAIKIFLMGLLILFGYFLVFYEDRYSIPVIFCFVFTSFYFFDKIDFFRYAMVNFFLVLIPFVAFGKDTVDAVRLWKSQLASYDQTMQVSQRIVQSHVFENKKVANAADAFGGTYVSMLALQTNCHYYGELGIYHTDESNWEELKRYKIDYLFYFGCAKIDAQGQCLEQKLPFYLKDKPIVYADPVAKLFVYKLF